MVKGRHVISWFYLYRNLRSGVFNPPLDKRWRPETFEISIIRFKTNRFFYPYSVQKLDNSIKEAEMCRRENHPCSKFQICSFYSFELETNTFKSVGSPPVRLRQCSGCGLLRLWKNWITDIEGTCQAYVLLAPLVAFPARQWGQAGRARCPSILTRE